MNAQDIWDRVLTIIRQEVSEISFNTWIKPLQAAGMNDQMLVLVAPNEFQKGHAENYKSLIQNSIQQLAGSAPDIHFVLGESEAEQLLGIHEVDNGIDNPYSSNLQTSGGAAYGSGGLSEELSAADSYQDVGKTAYKVANKNKPRFNPYYTFENFVVGPSNELAYATCVAVAQDQGEMSYNPLFLYGDSGLGKTHLMHAIGNFIQKNAPNREVLYVQTEQFVNEFITTIKDNRYDSFRSKFRNTDLLLIDDIQFIEGKPQMQIEFFHTFNALYERGSYIIMTCDKSPHNLSHLEDRLRTRFASGWFPEVLPPDFEMRKAILKKRAQYTKKDVPESVMDYIATNVTSNIRELEGAFNTVTAYALLAGELSLENAKIALRNVVDPKEAKPVTPEVIIDVTAAYFNLSSQDITSSKRSKDISDPRQMAMYLCRKELDLPYKQIGESFGNRDHSTVMHAYSKIERELESDNERLEKDLQEIKRRISDPGRSK